MPMNAYCFCRLLPFLVIVCLCACESGEEEDGDLDTKSAPYEYFSQQRSYPDRDFDWRGWRKALSRIRQVETQQRRENGCNDRPVNWTPQGPANIAGRVNALAVSPADQNVVLAGFSTGGIFKSTDAGVNWHPVFDDHLNLAIGSLAFSPTQPNVAYAGTGDSNLPLMVFSGNGLYKSTDAGETWQYLGLGEVGIISRIMLHPSNPQLLFAAAMGNPYVRDAARGVYRSTDGGQTWQQSLFVSDQAGASDLVIHPTNPQILYASFWDRIRNNHESVIYGPHARVYKTTDGGQTWALLGGGLPTGILGRTGLAISAQHPDKVYALYIDSLSTPGGLYKTTDGGQSWISLNISTLENACSNFGWYFGQIEVGPANDEELYFHGILLWRKAANSTAWQVAAGGHPDSHDLLFTPSGRRYWANDGGVYRNEPNSMVWTKSKNLPTTQMYRTDYNPHDPNNYYGGAQDNGIMKGNGANPNGWLPIFSDDGFHCAFHPTNANLFWIETQNGTIRRTDDGGQTFTQGQACLGTTDRCNWDTPFLLSVHNPDRLYAGTYRVYSSGNGTSWAPISADLTDGNIFGARFHSISCLDESPLQAEKLLAGTTDGNVWRREPNGPWTDLTGGLPNRYLTSVHGSPTLPQRLFVTHSGFRDDEYIPHLHRSDNNGAVWTDISGDLPQVPVNDLFVWPSHADSVLFAATDAGVYFSKNSGAHWARLGGNMPYLPTLELEFNPVRRELVAATFGRGIYTFPLDSVLSAVTGGMTVSLAGQVKTEAGPGVTPVRVQSQPPVQTEANGLFTIPGVPGCRPYPLQPYRNDQPLNGVSTFDLVLISRHILGLQPVTSPYKLIAADANRSNAITTLDIVVLRKLILGIDTVLANNTSWRFIPVAYVFPNPLNPFQTAFPETLAVDVQAMPLNGLDFVGIKVGDLNGSAIPGEFAATEERSPETWPLYAADRAFQRGELVEITLHAALHDLVAAQMTLWFDPTILVLEKTEPLLPGLRAENFGTPRSNPALLTVGFEHLFSTPNSSGTGGPTALFRLRLRAISDGRIAAACALRDAPTPALAFRPNGTVLRPVLVFSPLTSPAPSTLQAWPNPFGAAGVWLRLPPTSEGPFRLQVFDLQGKVVLEKKIMTGENDGLVQLESGWFNGAGMYVYRLEGHRLTWSGRLVKGR